jgi:lysophospholipase L1-like esterase
MNSRRHFLKKAAVGSALAFSLPEIVAAAIPDNINKVRLKSGGTILFQGDSITDAYRKRDVKVPNEIRALGNGYVFLTAGELLSRHASLKLNIYNRGISGNKVHQLAERWEEDCLNLKPDVLSVLIGVNDYWHKRNGEYDGTVKVYRDDYMALIERTKKALPDVRLIICEPFAITGTTAVDDTWFPEFKGYQDAAREVADRFGAVFIPFQSLFDKARAKASGDYWAPDGVHPSIAGAQLMATTLLKVVG